MKNYARMPLLAAAAMLLCAGTAQAAQLEMNGGFETGDFTGWTQFPNAGTQSITTVNPSEGTYAANLFIATETPENTIIKNANIGVGVVNPGDEITVSFDMRGSAVNGGVVFAEFFSELDGGGVSQAEILGGGPLFPTTEWMSYSYTVFAGPDVSGGVTLQLAAICAPVTGCQVDAYFDNVSVSLESAVIPVPAALWLFGGALGLLGLTKRRNR